MNIQHLVTAALFGFVALVSGCVSGSIQKEKIYPEPEQGKGLVYFYRERKFVGGAVGYNIKEGDTVIGAIKNGTYFFVQATPGTHTYTAATEASTARTITIEAGKTYYFECGVDIGVFAGRPAMKIANSEEARSVLPNLKYLTK